MASLYQRSSAPPAAFGNSVASIDDITFIA
jgi:hypothetical protein